MPFNQIATSVTIINSGLIGYQGISLTDFTATTVSAIATGSSVEISGAFFKATEDITINASSWTAITTGLTAFVTLTPSGTAGSQILTAAYTTDVPTWSTSKQGWYASASSTVRYVAGMKKSGASSYTEKWVFERTQEKIKPSGMLTIFSTQTIIAPANVVYVTGCASGGNGGTNPSGSGSGGGGGGSWAIKKAFYVTPGETLTVTIGAVGSNTTISSGTAVFTLNCGGNASTSTGGTGGAIGSGTGAGGNGGNVYCHGQPGFASGGAAQDTDLNDDEGGGGGGSYSNGGHGGITSIPNGTIGGYGGGGGGGFKSNAGSSGGPGIIILEW